MSKKIRTGNDIDITWSLKDADEQPYIVEGKNVEIELNVGTKRVKIKEFELSGNSIHFVYYGMDQKYTGSYALKYIENPDLPDMVTFDTKDAFTLVDHSWLAIDEGETPEAIQLEVVTVVSDLLERVGPPGPQGPAGPAAKVGEVTAEIDANIGTPAVNVTTSGPDERKNIHFAFSNLRGPRGLTGAVLWPEIYVDSDMHLHIVEPYPALSERLYVTDGKLYLRN